MGTTIYLKEKTHQKLETEKGKGQSFDGFIRELLEVDV
jgi:predicted CopG family antitoxin